MHRYFIPFLAILFVATFLTITIMVIVHSEVLNINSHRSLQIYLNDFSPNEKIPAELIIKIHDKTNKEKVNPNDNLKSIIQNIPYIYFQENAKFPLFHNESCARFPKLLEIKFTHHHWQTLKTTNKTLQLFSAYFDHRNVKDGKRAIRIISMYDEFNSNATFYCQFWYEQSEKPVVVESEKLIWTWIKEWGGDNKGLFHSYIVTCLLPSDIVIPMSVSVVVNECDNANNNLRISYKSMNEEAKKDFVVCVKGLNFPNEDKSIRMVEWIELLFILGADKINFYKFHVDPNVQKVLDYYTSSSKVEVTPISLVDGASNIPFLQSKYLREHFYEQIFPELITYNDCLYKHLNEFNFVVLLDTDEVIVPTNGETWSTLIKNMKRVWNEGRSSFIARNVYFLDSRQHDHDWFEGIPRFLYMLQHVHRSNTYSELGFFSKGFHNTSRIIALHNHYPIDCFGGCWHGDIGLEYGQLQHYRFGCDSNLKECKEDNTVTDSNLWNYKDLLVKKSLQTLFNLDLIELK